MRETRDWRWSLSIKTRTSSVLWLCVVEVILWGWRGWFQLIVLMAALMRGERITMRHGFSFDTSSEDQLIIDSWFINTRVRVSTGIHHGASGRWYVSVSAMETRENWGRTGALPRSLWRGGVMTTAEWRGGQAVHESCGGDTKGLSKEEDIPEG